MDIYTFQRNIRGIGSSPAFIALSIPTSLDLTFEINTWNRHSEDCERHTETEFAGGGYEICEYSEGKKALPLNKPMC